MLYLQDSRFRGSPKEISERTSYLQVRLEFHRYLHLIPAFFNRHGFGPPVRFTAPSPLDMGRSPGFGYITTYFIRPFQTRFRCGSGFSTLTLHVIMTRRFILQEGTPSPINGLRQLVGTWFQELFHSLPGCFSPSPLTVLVHYRSLGSICLALRDVLADSDGVSRVLPYSGS